jgi:cell surface protein SprA
MAEKALKMGLPVGPVAENVETTIWGQVPTVQAIVNAFDNNPESRQYQDVGFDGLSSEQEREFFADNFPECHCHPLWHKFTGLSESL